MCCWVQLEQRDWATFGCEKRQEGPAPLHHSVVTIFTSVKNNPVTYIAQTEQWWHRSGFISWHLSQNRIPESKDLLIPNARKAFFCHMLILCSFPIYSRSFLCHFKVERVCSWLLLPGHRQRSNARHCSGDLQMQGTILTAKHPTRFKVAKQNCTPLPGFQMSSDFTYIPFWFGLPAYATQPAWTDSEKQSPQLRWPPLPVLVYTGNFLAISARICLCTSGLSSFS